MARRSLPEFAILWQRHESLYLMVFSTALHELAEKGNISGDEDAISETFCPILNSVCFNIAHLQNREIRTPCWEGPIPPVSDDELKGGKIRKRPDFTCNCINSYAISAEEYQIPFHVECKRIGQPTSSSWILNKNYVSNGIKRFDCPDHEYGKRASSGLMIGYLIDMVPEDVLKEINDFQAKEYPTNKTITIAFAEKYVNSTSQFLQRINVKPKDFKLTHMWIDLRHNYQNQ